MSKLRAPILGVMLGAAALGCTTITPWRTVDTEQKQVGAEVKVIENVGTKTVSTREFQISDNYIEGDSYKTKITESLEKTVYNLKQEKKTRRVQETLIEKRETNTEIIGPLMAGLFTTVGGLGGVAVANLSDENSSTLKKIGYGAAGAGGGLLLGFWLGSFAKPTTKTETKRTDTGIVNLIEEGEVRETFLKKELVYENTPANAKIGIVGKEETYQVWNGIIEWGDKSSNRFVTRELLEKKLYDFPLVQQMKPATRDSLREKLLGAASEYIEKATIETRERSADPSLIIKNASKGLWFKYHVLRDEDIYNIVKAFVDENINSKIKTIKFNVRDDLAHVPIIGSNFEFQTDAPSKSSLLEKYFTGGLKDYSERFVRDYLIGRGRADSLPDSFEWQVYSPSNIFLEVTHPEYKFVDGEIQISNKGISVNGDLQEIVDGKTQMPVYMADKGKKTRVEEVGESKGRIGKAGSN